MARVLEAELRPNEIQDLENVVGGLTPPHTGKNRS